MRAGPPPLEEPWPGVLRDLAGSGGAQCLWRNAAGGLTFRLAGGEGRILKWAPAESGVDLRDEAERLGWAAPQTPVPVVLDCGEDRSGTWLLTREIVGESAVSERFLADPTAAALAIGEGLRAMHEALDLASCPYSWSAASRLALARERDALGLGRTSEWHVEHRHLGPKEALARLAAAPPVDRLVVCHGDACAPNTLLDAGGRFLAHVDLGALGVADRWADLAVATWSTNWNYGPGFEDLVLVAYGVSPDPERTAYYRLLWDLGS